ncbi:PREDICTED: uncharacterized protein LOC104590458 [Nelumbo nucifera]|uniref:Uncharacterized protein LOC104590458 n=1 Tax=Nelumbo nucifera TaxID=4432 RepID=A0A1U7ZGZ4_NELNU|nr:PREDICTED: uncharacterized protein LOC104590458 [Nelumbo nucifera]
MANKGVCTRCSPKRFNEPISNLGLRREHNEALNAIPFGQLICIPPSTFDKALIVKMVQRWDPETCTFNLGGVYVPFIDQDIALILELRLEGCSVITGIYSSVPEFINHLFGLSGDSSTQPLLSTVEEKFLSVVHEKLNESTEDVVKLILLHLFGLILFPQGGPV